MSTTFTRVPSVLVTNTQAANTGNSIATIRDGDVVLFDKTFTEVSDLATVQTAPDVDVLYVGLGVGTTGAVDPGYFPIQVRNVRLVKVTPYVAAVQYAATISAIAAPTVAAQEYVVKIIYRDQFTSAPGHSAPRSYSYISTLTDTPTLVATGLAAKINADKNAQVIASVAGASLVLTAKVIAPNAIDYYQRVSFDVALPVGFAEATAVITYATGTQGNGTGQLVKDLEQTTKTAQRILFPIPTETTKASLTGIYNLVTIEHYAQHVGDMATLRSEPLKTVIAFASGSAVASAKQAAFMVKLTSVIESIGVYVS